MKNTNSLNLARMSNNETADIKINGYGVHIHKLNDTDFCVEIVRKVKMRGTSVLTEYCDDYFRPTQVEKLLELLPQAYTDFEVGRVYADTLHYVPKDKPTPSGKGKAKRPRKDRGLGTDINNAWWLDQPSEQTLLLEGLGVKPKRGKSKKSALELDLDKLAGTGDNSAAHKVMCKHGLRNSKTAEYKAVWQGYWWNIR